MFGSSADMYWDSYNTYVLISKILHMFVNNFLSDMNTKTEAQDTEI